MKTTNRRQRRECRKTALSRLRELRETLDPNCSQESCGSPTSLRAYQHINVLLRELKSVEEALCAAESDQFRANVESLEERALWSLLCRRQECGDDDSATTRGKIDDFGAGCEQDALLAARQLPQNVLTMLDESPLLMDAFALELGKQSVAQHQDTLSQFVGDADAEQLTTEMLAELLTSNDSSGGAMSDEDADVSVLGEVGWMTPHRSTPLFFGPSSSSSTLDRRRRPTARRSNLLLSTLRTLSMRTQDGSSAPQAAGGAGAGAAHAEALGSAPAAGTDPLFTASSGTSNTVIEYDDVVGASRAQQLASGGTGDAHGARDLDAVPISNVHRNSIVKTASARRLVATPSASSLSMLTVDDDDDDDVQEEQNVNDEESTGSGGGGDDDDDDQVRTATSKSKSRPTLRSAPKQQRSNRREHDDDASISFIGFLEL
jgi:hypothetical protein